jgi:hypothetical protein
MIFEDAAFFGLLDAIFLYRRGPVHDGRGHSGHPAIYFIYEASAYAAATVWVSVFS